MEKTRLDLSDLTVDTFDTTETTASVSGPNYALAADPFCCTGCTTGCGINPTAGGCESGGGAIAY